MKKKPVRLRVRRSAKKSNRHWLLGYMSKFIPLFVLILIVSSVFLARFVFARTADVVLATPRNSSPNNNAVMDTYNFKYSWTAVTSALADDSVTYSFEISHYPDTELTGRFKEPVAFDSGQTIISDLSTANIDNMVKLDGVYYWHVKAASAKASSSNWSNSTKISLSTRPPKPANSFPTNDSVIKINSCNDYNNLKFSWQDLTSLNNPVTYTLEFSDNREIYDPTYGPCDNNQNPLMDKCYRVGYYPQNGEGGFRDTSITLSGLENHIVNSPLQLGGDYYWHVKTVYKDPALANNVSEWSDVYHVFLDQTGFDVNCFSTPTPTLP